MKKISTLVFTVLLSSTMTQFAVAHQDRSFTNVATAGIFEDMYDFFKANPAYMPGFQKNAFWGQLSNLQSRGDALFGNAAAHDPITGYSIPWGSLEYLDAISSNDYYMVGSQFDIGVGRVGLMLDWNGSTSAISNRAFGESDTHYGFGDTSTIDYRDLNTDGELDYSRSLHGESEKSISNLTNDIYVAYGLGMFNMIDLGIGLRADWDSTTPTYSPDYSFGYNTSFKLKSSELQYNMQTQQEIMHWDETGTGSFSYGTTNIDIILGGRMKNVIPNLDVTAKIVPKISTTSNSYTWDYSSNSVAAFSNNLRSLHETGMQDFSDTYPVPGSGFGVEVGVRGDYVYTPNTIFIAELGVDMGSWKSKDGKKDSTRIIDSKNATLLPIPDTQESKTTTVISRINDDKSSSTTLNGNLRAHFLNTGWKWGAGLNAAMTSSSSEKVDTYARTETFRYTSTANPLTSYTDVTTSGSKDKTNSESFTGTIEFPLGMSIDLAKSLSLQLGVSHIISTSLTTEDMKQVEYAEQKTVRTYDGAAPGLPSYAGYSENITGHRSSSLNMTHNNNFSYGLTWLPYENLQLDVSGFASGLTSISLLGYRLSANIYF